MQSGIVDDGDILGYFDERPASFAVNSVGHLLGPLLAGDIVRPCCLALLRAASIGMEEVQIRVTVQPNPELLGPRLWSSSLKHARW